MGGGATGFIAGSDTDTIVTKRQESPRFGWNLTATTVSGLGEVAVLRRLTVLGVAVALFAALFGVQIAFGHECQDDNGTPPCQDSAVVPNWRDSYVPLFEVNGRNDDEAARKDAQRWREECGTQQMCQWAYGGTSAYPNPDDGGGEAGVLAPNELHVGFAASHCFLFEAMHQCEGHGASNEEGVHDKHGGAIYADACATKNPQSPHCDDGIKDTQVGVTVVDHNACGVIVPIVACIDEYHVIRPLDTAYTNQQLANTQAGIERMYNNPRRYLCGYGPGSDDCVAGGAPSSPPAPYPGTAPLPTLPELQLPDSPPPPGLPQP